MMRKFLIITVCALVLAACSWRSGGDSLSVSEFAQARYGGFDCELITFALLEKGKRVNAIYAEQGLELGDGGITAHETGFTFSADLDALEDEDSELAAEHRLLKREMRALYVVSLQKKCESIPDFFFGLETAQK